MGVDFVGPLCHGNCHLSVQLHSDIGATEKANKYATEQPRLSASENTCKGPAVQ